MATQEQTCRVLCGGGSVSDCFDDTEGDGIFLQGEVVFCVAESFN